MREQGMTREQRLELLKQIEKDICVCSIESTFLDDAKSCAIHSSIEELEQEPVLDKIRAEIEQKIEQERFARSVFRCEEKDAVKAEQCTGSIFAYNNVIKLIDKYKAEQGVSE